MTARFRDLLVVTYAFPAPVLEPLVPAAFTLDHHQGHGFVAIALVDMARLRPSALPAALGKTPTQPPAGSPFSSWAQARPFAGPLPWTFAPDASGEAAVAVKGVRDRWDPRPLRIEQADVALFRQLPFAAARPRLAAAFHLHDLTYAWTAGMVEPLATMYRRTGASR
jgi:hypothetical protein